MTQISLKQARWEVCFFAVATAVGIGCSAFFASFLFATEPFAENNKNVIYVFLFGLVSMSLITLGCFRHFLYCLFEARDASVSGDVVTLSYLHLGERQYTLSPMQIRKTRIDKKRLGLDAKEFEPMWLLRFSGWRFAVVPIDWENPLEPSAP